MENKSVVSNEETIGISRTQELIREWKRRKQEDEKVFLQEINTPEHQEKMEAIRGKTVRDETASA